jgi:hypothetical protein
MNDKTDPRLDVAMRASARWHRNEDIVDSDDHSLAWFILDAIDAADRAAGIVRVDTTDAFTRTLVSDAVESSVGAFLSRRECHLIAGTVLSALREAAQ